jgi:hypothetical protein
MQLASDYSKLINLMFVVVNSLKKKKKIVVVKSNVDILVKLIHS